MFIRFWLIVWISRFHIMSNMLSPSMEFGVDISWEETHFRWEEELSENEFSTPGNWFSLESTKLAMLSSRVGKDWLHISEISLADRFVWETRSRQLDSLSQITLFEIFEATLPLAFQNKPPPLPLMSKPEISASTLFKTTEWWDEFELTDMSSIMTNPEKRLPVLSISTAGSLRDPCTLLDISCRSMLSFTTIPLWSPWEVQVWHVTFLPPLMT